MKLKMSKDPIPHDPGTILSDWLDNAVNRMNEHGTTLGVVAADKTKFNDWCVMAKDACLGLAYAVTAEESWREYRDDLLNGSNVDSTPLTRPVDNTPLPPSIFEPLLPGAMSRIRDFLQSIKRKQAWSTSIESDFRITPITVEIDVDTAKPEGSAKGMAGADVVLSWVRGPFDGVVIEWQLDGATAWNSLGTINGSKYTHKAPLALPGKPEGRHYRLRFVLDNNPVGEWSNGLSVTVRP